MNHPRIKTGIVILFLLAVSFSAFSCAKQPVSGAFELVILNESIVQGQPGLGYSRETSDPAIMDAYPSQVNYTITAADIEKYVWDDQEIVLTANASKAFVDRFGACETALGRTEDLQTCLGLNPFAVMYDGQYSFGGLFLGDAPISTSYVFPIIYPQYTDGRVIFRLQPDNGGFLNGGVYTAEEWQLIKDERIKALFEKLGKLEQ